MTLMPYVNAARCTFCPDDPWLWRPLYNLGATLPRREFIDSLAIAAFPTGSKWMLSAIRFGIAQVWRVQGDELHSLDGNTVLRAMEDKKQQVTLKEMYEL